MEGDAVVVLEETCTTAPCDPSKSVVSQPQRSIDNTPERSRIDHAKVVWQKSRWIHWLLIFTDWRIRFTFAISDQAPYVSFLGILALTLSGNCAMFSTTPLWWFCRPSPGSPIGQQLRELQGYFEVCYTALSFRSVLRADICSLLAHQVRFASNPYAMLAASCTAAQALLWVCCNCMLDCVWNRGFDIGTSEVLLSRPTLQPAGHP